MGSGQSQRKKKNVRRKSPSANDKTNKLSLKEELVLLALIGLFLIVFLGNFGLAGAGGRWITNPLFGLFGGLQYVLPIYFIISICFCFANKRNFNLYLKIVCAFLAIVILCTLIELLRGTDNMNQTFISYYTIGLERHIFSGGAMGGCLANFLYHILGILASIFILLIILIGCLVFLTERSFFSGLGSKSRELINAVKEDRDSRREMATVTVDRPERTDAHARQGTRHSEDVHEVFMDSDPLNIDTGINENEDIMNNSELEKRTSTTSREPEHASTPIEIEKPFESKNVNFEMPSISLLKKGKAAVQASNAYLSKTGLKLQQTLQSFGVNVTVVNVSCGPSVTRYELQPDQGVKVSRIVGLADDIKLNLAVSQIRIEAPIPGKAAVGIEIPNREISPVLLRDLLESKEFARHPSPITFAVGKDIAGKVIVADIAKMPHLLIAGATGSGKSVCINTLIISILYKADPKRVKLIMIDPKVVELSVYSGIPHMLIPVVTDPKKAAGALHWAVSEMTERYKKFAEQNVRDLKGYNDKVKQLPAVDGEKPEVMPQIVIVVDELADLMMVSKKEVEDAIVRLAQLARAAGIHLIIATQRPSVDVITGLIKANMPSRIAFAVSSGVDSRTIIDIHGAEKLLGRGDMLFYPSGYPKPVRVQGAFVSDKEVSDVVKFMSEQKVEYNEEVEERVNSMQSDLEDAGGADSDHDEYFFEAAKFVIEKDKGSIGMLQRVFKIGFNRAARIMEQLEKAGIVSEEEASKQPRRVLMSLEELEVLMK